MVSTCSRNVAPQTCFALGSTLGVHIRSMCFVVELLLNCFWYFQLLCRNKAVKHTSTSMISKDGCFTSSVTVLGFILSFLMRWEIMTEFKAEIRILKSEVQSVKSEVQTVKTEIQTFEEEVNNRFDKIDQRFDKVDQRFNNLPEELSTFLSQRCD